MNASSKLSRRLEAVAGFVTVGNELIDIGTDHAYLPIELVKRGVCPRAIAADVAPGPLERASAHIRQSGLGEQIETVLSNGLENIPDTAGKTLTIAGMGGPLALDILLAYPDRVLRLYEAVFQIQSRIEGFRAGLRSMGFVIADEAMVEEEGKYYPVIKVYFGQSAAGSGSPGTMPGETGQQDISDEMADRYGTALIAKKDPTLLRFLEFEAATLDKAIGEIKGRSRGFADGKEKMKELERRHYVNREAYQMISGTRQT